MATSNRQLSTTARPHKSHTIKSRSLPATMLDSYALLWLGTLLVGTPRYPDRTASSAATSLTFGSSPASAGTASMAALHLRQQRARGDDPLPVRRVESRPTAADGRSDRRCCRGREPCGQRDARRPCARVLRARPGCATCRNGRLSGARSRLRSPAGAALVWATRPRSSWRCSPSVQRSSYASPRCLETYAVPQGERHVLSRATLSRPLAAHRGQLRRPAHLVADARAQRRSTRRHRAQPAQPRGTVTPPARRSSHGSRTPRCSACISPRL